MQCAYLLNLKCFNIICYCTRFKKVLCRTKNNWHHFVGWQILNNIFAQRVKIYYVNNILVSWWLLHNYKIRTEPHSITILNNMTNFQNHKSFVWWEKGTSRVRKNKFTLYFTAYLFTYYNTPPPREYI